MDHKFGSNLPVSQCNERNMTHYRSHSVCMLRKPCMSGESLPLMALNLMEISSVGYLNRALSHNESYPNKILCQIQTHFHKAVYFNSPHMEQWTYQI